MYSTPKIRIVFGGLLLSFAALLSSALYLPSETLVSNPNLKPVTSARIGLFVNSGNKKVDRLQCYDFDNLLLAFKTDSTLLQYDKVIVTVNVSFYYKGEKWTQFGSHNFLRTFQKSSIQEWVKNPVTKVWIFKNAQDMKEEAPFKHQHGSGFDYSLTRSRLEFHNDRENLRDYVLTVKLTGSTYKADKGTSELQEIDQIELPLASTYTSDTNLDYAAAVPTAAGCYPASSLPEKQNPFQ